MYKNYIFDLYGTLVDIKTNENKASLWKKMALFYRLKGADWQPVQLKRAYRALVMQEENRLTELTTVSREHVEIRLESVFAELYRQKGVEPITEMIHDTGVIFRAISLEYIKLFNGAEALLDRLRENGKKVYLLSNAQRMFTEPEMRMLGIYDKFDGILYSSDAGVKKPAADFFQTLFDRYDLQKEESVMIGNDVTADMSGAADFGLCGLYIHTAQSGEHSEKLPEGCREMKEIGEVFS